jgi:predicted cupin superfamily sugar epimerase/uncharacterized protein YdhG (YjbR/CyaY superfamily)/GNAT superfamily N-acetyltransferase
VVVRPIREEDVEPVVELMLANYDGVLSEQHSPAVVARFRAEITPHRLRQQMHSKRVYVVEDAGQVIAAGALADYGTSEEPSYTVSELFVRPDRQGRGIGRHLLEHLVGAARAVGAEVLRVPSSRNAIPFYEEAGFEVDASQPDAGLEITWMTRTMSSCGGRVSAGRTRGEARTDERVGPMPDRSTARSIDDYIAGFPSETRVLLEELRALIRAAAPDATETISYAIPTFDLSGRHLVHFAGYAGHVGFYPTASGIAAFKEELGPYKSAKGSVQFPLDRPYGGVQGRGVREPRAMMKARDIARLLSLEPHPEGGFFRETYRSGRLVATPTGLRSMATGILFLVTAASPSRFHRLRSDELWLYHAGAPLELVALRPDGSSERVLLVGTDRPGTSDECSPQAIVPGGSWQAARVVVGDGSDEHAWALVSCIVTPGFDYADFELADGEELVVAYPLEADLVRQLT